MEVKDRRLDQGLDRVSHRAGRLDELPPGLPLGPECFVHVEMEQPDLRVGYPHKGWRSALYTHHARPRTLSAIGFHLASIAALGWPAPYRVPELHVSPARRDEARTELARLDVPARAPCVGFHPGARWPTRRWAADRFVELARRFLDAHPAGIALVTGADSEREQVAAIVASLLPGRRFLGISFDAAVKTSESARCPSPRRL